MTDFIKGTFCSYCGSLFNEQKVWPRTCVNCNNITYVNPLPIVVTLVPVRFGILIQKRNIEPKKGEWALPGGYINIGETWQQAAARELKEEIGLDTNPEDHNFFTIKTAANSNILIFTFLFDDYVRESELINFKPNEEVTAIKVAYGPMELGFPTHTEVLKEYLDG